MRGLEHCVTIDIENGEVLVAHNADVVAMSGQDSVAVADVKV